jgi:TRAP-type mannitol/chloroaromatic compound transport system permease small subunit
MPSITFVLPHWLYWSGLLCLPLLAMFMVRRQQGRQARRGLTYPIAYMLWLCGGFVGIHRFYVKSTWGMLYIPLFILILLGNVQVKEATNQVSGAKNQLSIAEFDLERAQNAVTRGVEGAEQRLAQTRQSLASARQALAKAQAEYTTWHGISGGLAAVMAILLLLDACLLPRLLRRCARLEAREAEPVHEAPLEEVYEAGTHEDPTVRMHVRLFNWIDQVNGFAGEFVSYWSVIAVFVYYYEVLARYVFNSPTNWAHESMFLMFGMQYMLAGAYTYREDGHVRVDVVYLYFPDRIKALVDVITSIFFFIFAVALLWTGWIFMTDALSVWEVSFTEWAIQYWPVKITMPLGALLLVLQGLSKLCKDLVILTGKQA